MTTEAEDTGLRIAGSLWSVPPLQQPDLIARAIEGGIDAFHWDVSDGTLGRAGGFTHSDRARLMGGTSMSEEVHLMVSHPLDYVDEWTECCELIVIHIESHDWRAAADRVQRRGRNPALAVSPRTSLNAIPHDAARVLVMSVEPGSAGSGFESRALSRAAEISRTRRPSRLGLDGSVDLDTIGPARDRGVNWLISGGAMFGNAEPDQWISQARERFGA